MSPISAAGLLGGAIAALPQAASAVGKLFSVNAPSEASKAEALPFVAEDDITTASLTKKLAEMVRLRGIQPDPDSEIVVEDDGAGGVRVKGPPDVASAVRDVLAENPDWVKDFRQLLKNSPNASIVLGNAEQGLSSIDLTA